MAELGIKILQNDRFKTGIIVVYILVILGISASARALGTSNLDVSLGLVSFKYKVRPVLDFRSVDPLPGGSFENLVAPYFLKSQP
jgi:hypothetical protein